MSVFDTSLKISPEMAVIVVATCFLAPVNIILASTLCWGRRCVYIKFGKFIKIFNVFLFFSTSRFGFCEVWLDAYTVASHAFRLLERHIQSTVMIHLTLGTVTISTARIQPLIMTTLSFHQVSPPPGNCAYVLSPKMPVMRPKRLEEISVF
jgi:hypothetical protein